MATKKEEKQFEKERKAANKARYKKMKKEGLEKYLTPEQIRYNKNQKLVGMVWPIFRFFILFGLSFVILYPLIFMFSTAFRPSDQMSDPSIIWIPKTFTLSNIKDTWDVMRYDSTILNTIRLNLISSCLQVLTCSITGYGFARFKFKGKNLLFAIVILMIIVPPQITTIPLFMQYRYLFPLDLFGVQTDQGLIDSSLTMYLPALFANGIKAGLFIFIFRQFFRGLPKELEDAAYLDGCGPLKTYIKVMVPNAKSSFLTVFLFSIVWYWNDFYVSSSFFINNSENQTVALALKNLDKNLENQLFQNQSVSIRMIIVWLESGCILAIAPLLVMYIFLQRYFIEGVERSGLVG
ncbi:MAG: carbohydrate ABC transporter permease [Ruminococcus sp.]|nr:carbohydrate ABC transporter permease [Ruminococcus sp.]